MTVQLDLTALLMLLGVPSAVTGFFFWLLQKKLSKRDAQRDAIDKARRKNELLVVRGVGAAIALGEATARSIKRLDPNCNGEMENALKYASKVKHEQKDFLGENAIGHIY